MLKCYTNHHAKFEIDRTILICLDLLKDISVTDKRRYGRTDSKRSLYPNKTKPIKLFHPELLMLIIVLVLLFLTIYI